jgi:hypothetical protein
MERECKRSPLSNADWSQHFIVPWIEAVEQAEPAELKACRVLHSIPSATDKAPVDSNLPELDKTAVAGSDQGSISRPLLASGDGSYEHDGWN